MLESPHVAVGAAIATKIPNPVISIPAALASHFLLDRVPHWNPHTYTETQKHGRPTKQTTIFAFGDSILALAIGLFFAWLAMPNLGHAVTIIIASFVSVLPDTIKIPFHFFKVNGVLKKYVDFERSLQVEIKDMWLGLAIQAGFIVASFWWILS